MAVLTPDEWRVLEEAERRAAYPLRVYDWTHYPKHRAFFAAGAAHRERLLIAANRVGKTQAAAYETALHLTGLYNVYAPWWEGRRFAHPVKWWAAGNTGKTTRDILQAAYCGEIDKTTGNRVPGMIPTHLIDRTTPKAGLPDAFESVYVRHVSGGVSHLQFKSYDQKREAFEGTSQHGIHLDEEPPEDIYTESLLRTMTTDGCVMMTFTPLMGLTPLVLSFLPGGRAEA